MPTAKRCYFAYGSNMSSAEMRAYCPGAVDLGRARLDGWRLGFTAHSDRRQGGVADIVPVDCPVGMALADYMPPFVWGVLWEVDEAELPALHAKEGYVEGRPRAENQYDLVDATVLLHGVTGRERQAFAYEVVNKAAAHLKPYADYAAILRTGAMEHRLPQQYWECVEELMARADAIVNPA